MHTPYRIRLQTIPSGYRGTLRTIGHVGELIRRGAKDFLVRRTAVAILRQCAVRPKDYLGEIKALFEWVQRNVRYTRDIFRVEVLHSARRMLELRAGDCDDMTILLGALLEAVGHPVRLVVTGHDPQRQDLFSHIYPEVLHQGRWIPLDATMPHPMGWAPMAPVKKTFGIDRRPEMAASDSEFLGSSAAVPVWLPGVLRSVRGGAIGARDPRIRLLWTLLKQRQVLRRSPWLMTALRRIWNGGLPARPHPRTAARIVRTLRMWAVLPPRSTPSRPVAASPPRPIDPRVVMRAIRPVALQPIATLRPATLQPVRPVQVQRLSYRAARR